MLLCTESAVEGQSLAVLPNNLDQLVSTAGKRPQESKVEQPKAHEQTQSSAQEVQVVDIKENLQYAHKHINTKSNLLTSFEARFTMCPIES